MTFSADWLTMREPHDRAARNSNVLSAVEAHFAKHTTLNVVDVACGTGSTMRAVGPRLSMPQTWRLVDNDLGLLLRAAAQPKPDRATIRTQPVDLARDLEIALDGAIDLVTASALLDLVSAEWLERFATEIAVRHLPVYVALTYNGDARFEPNNVADEPVRWAFNEHQRGEKGFGLALGPEAATQAPAAFARLGYVVTPGASPWRLGEATTALQNEVVSGYAHAASEQGSVPMGQLNDWLSQRRALIAAGRSRISIGHIDFFATPPRR